MKVLALDTTTRAGSVAVIVDDVVVEQRAGDGARSHAERLPAELIAIADAHGLALADFELFAVASGPGSFTGLRIGIATMQGLAFVGQRPIVGVSALEALAHAISDRTPPGSIVSAWMDAYRREVFAALYRTASSGPFEPERLVELDAARVGDPQTVIDDWSASTYSPAAFVGDGAMLYRDVIAHGFPSATIAAAPLLAGAIGRLAAARARRGETVGPAGIQPLYVRRPDAELARDAAARR